MPHEPMQTRTLLPVFLTVIAITVVGLFVATRDKKTASTNTNRTTTNTNESTPVQQPAAVPAEPAAVYSRMGTISSIGASSITMRASIYNDETRQYAISELTVRITGGTVLRQEDRRRMAPIAVAGTSSSRPSSGIAYKEIRSGDTVEVVSETNIRGETTITAQSLTKLLLP